MEALLKLTIEILKAFPKYIPGLFLILAISDSLSIHFLEKFNQLHPDIKIWFQLAEIPLWIGVIVILFFYSVSFAIKSRQDKKNKRKFTVTFPLPHTHIWHEAKQPDGTIITQIHANVQIRNRSEHALGLTTVRLIKPKIIGETVQSVIFVKETNSPYSGTLAASDFRIDQNVSRPCSISLLIRGSLNKELGEIVPTCLAISDDDGHEVEFTMNFKVV